MVLGEELLLIGEGSLGCLASRVPPLLENDFPGHSDGPRGFLGVLCDLMGAQLQFSSYLLLHRVYLLVQLWALALIVLLLMQVYKLHHFLDDPCSLLLLLYLLRQVHLRLISRYHLLLLLHLVASVISGDRRHWDVKTVPQVVPLFNQIENGLDPLIVRLRIERHSLSVVQQGSQLQWYLPQKEIVRVPHLQDALLRILTLQEVQGEHARPGKVS